MKKRLLSVTVFTLLIVMIFSVFSACGKPEDPINNDYDKTPAPYTLGYSLSPDGSYYSVKCTEMNRICDVTVPAEYNGIPVKKIDASAFWGYGNFLVSITLPEGITEIGESAFSGCYRLSDITLPSTLTEIGGNAFVSCTSLIEICNKSKLDIQLREGNKHGGITANAENVYTDKEGESRLTRDGDFVFYDDGEYRALVTYKGSAAEVILPTADDYVIRDFAFLYNTSAVSLTVPSCVAKISGNAFAGCYKLTEIYNKSALNIVAGSEENGNVAQYAENVYTDKEGESKLFRSGDFLFYRGEENRLMAYSGDKSEIVLPTIDGGYAIGKYALNGNALLRKITVPSGVRGIDESGISACTYLESVTLGDDVEYIGYSAFASCGRLKEINFPASVKEIDEKAFMLCTSLNSLTVPSTVETVGKNAFMYCGGLTEVTVSEGVLSLGVGAFESCGGLKKATVAGSVKHVNENTFAFCRELKELVLCEGIESIESRIIVGCGSLDGVVIPKSVQSIQGNAFENGNLIALYYKGTEAEFAEVTVNGTLSQTVYYYSESKPSAVGNYWHYENGSPVVW